MPRWITLFLYIPTLLTIVTGCMLPVNSGSNIITKAEKDFGNLIELGTSKSGLISFLSNSKYDYFERSEALGNHFLKGDNPNEPRCQGIFGNSSFQWRCQYHSLISTGTDDVGFLPMWDPYISLYFAFDENDKLVEYARRVSYVMP